MVYSHELRNPLSAILQCAEDITLSTSEVRQSQGGTAHEQLDGILDSAQSITLCALHQKRIIDDILSVSKLDSSMLSITPVATDPCNVVHQVLFMFNALLRAEDINFTFATNPSVLDLTTTQVYCDPSRLTQILINLLSNAIKFTKTQHVRDISLTLQVFDEPPSQIVSDLKWFSSNGFKAVADQSQDKKLYLMFTVKDSGKGMSSDEMALLLRRFSQASPKTHVEVSPLFPQL